MKIEDLKAGRVYRAKRPRVVHTLGGSYINDRQILSISPFEDTIQYDSPKVGFGSKYSVISVEKFLKWAAKDITDDLPPDEADLDHSDGCPLLGVIVVNEPDSEPIIYLR